MKDDIEKRKQAFMAAAKGLTAHQVSAVINRTMRGVNWSGSSKGRMAEAYATRQYDGAIPETAINALKKAPRETKKTIEYFFVSTCDDDNGDMCHRIDHAKATIINDMIVIIGGRRCELSSIARTPEAAVDNAIARSREAAQAARERARTAERIMESIVKFRSDLEKK